MTQTAALTWDEVLKRENLVGGDIESVEDGVTYRGPLAKIEASGDIIRFTSPWCARMNDSGEWEKHDITSSFISHRIEPQDIGDGRIHFSIPSLGPCTIFPKGGGRLDPDKVKGLPPASERLLALYPDLPFDREKAKTAILFVIIPSLAEVIIGTLDQLPTDATLGDLLSAFETDGQKQEFLRFYIETVTDEKNVAERVY